MTADTPFDSAAAFALGAIDPVERAALEALFERDAEFRRQVLAYRDVAGLLAYAAPTLHAPPTLRDRILTQARGVRPLSSAPTIKRKAAFLPLRALPWVAAAACLGIVVSQSGRLREAQSATNALRAEVASLQGEVANRDSSLAAFMGPEVHVVSLNEGSDKPSARVYWNHTKKLFIVTAFNVPRAPDGKTYQLWAIRKGQAPLSMGTFNTDASGRAVVIVPVGNTVNEGGFIDLCGMTMEPQGGSLQPTEQPRLVGSWRHTD